MSIEAYMMRTMMVENFVDILETHQSLPTSLLFPWK